MRFFILLIATFYLANQAIANPTSVDERAVIVDYVGQWRSHMLTKGYGEAKQCRILWQMVESKLVNNVDLDVVNLARISEIIKKETGDIKLIAFVDDCIRHLSAKYRTVKLSDKDDLSRFNFQNTNVWGHLYL